MFDLKRRCSSVGATILEAIVAAAVLIISLSGVFATFGRTVAVVRNAKTASAAQLNTNARIEQVRSAGWAKVTDPTYLATLIATPISASAENIEITKEVISIYPTAVPLTLPLPSATPAPVSTTSPYCTITKTGSSAPEVNPSGFDASTLLSARELNFRILTEWRVSGRTHHRELATMLSKSATR